MRCPDFPARCPLDVLGLSVGQHTDEEIRRALRKCSQSHPDRQGPNGDDSVQKAANIAARKLLDPEWRKDHIEAHKPPAQPPVVTPGWANDSSRWDDLDFSRNFDRNPPPPRTAPMPTQAKETAEETFRRHQQEVYQWATAGAHLGQAFGEALRRDKKKK